jgi:hypothetical protein
MDFSDLIEARHLFSDLIPILGILRLSVLLVLELGWDAAEDGES